MCAEHGAIFLRQLNRPGFFFRADSSLGLLEKRINKD
jgi:hypothetical protein